MMATHTHMCESKSERGSFSYEMGFMFLVENNLRETQDVHCGSQEASWEHDPNLWK